MNVRSCWPPLHLLIVTHALIWKCTSKPACRTSVHVKEMRTPSASAAPSPSILASVHMQVAGRVNGGQRTFAVSSYIRFTKKQIFHVCSIVKHLNKFFLFKVMGIYLTLHASIAVHNVLCSFCLLLLPLLLRNLFQLVEIMFLLKSLRSDAVGKIIHKQKEKKLKTTGKAIQKQSNIKNILLNGAWLGTPLIWSEWVIWSVVSEEWWS